MKAIMVTIIVIVVSMLLGFLTRKRFNKKNVKRSKGYFISTAIIFLIAVITAIQYFRNKDLMTLVTSLFMIFMTIWSLISGIQLRKKGE
ncbi:MAG: hypothetical protein ABH873_09475 [Candidatus Firestonebacteria bacterium]